MWGFRRSGSVKKEWTDAEYAEGRRVRREELEIRGSERFGRKSPPYAERRKGWGTLKFRGGRGETRVKFWMRIVGGLALSAAVLLSAWDGVALAQNAGVEETVEGRVKAVMARPEV